MDEPQVTINDVHPALREVVREFLLKCKYPFVMRIDGYYESVDEKGHAIEYRTEVSFYDPAFPLTHGRVGGLAWRTVPHPEHRRFFRTITRNSINLRFRDSERRRAVDTANPKRAVQAMLKHITPLSLAEIAAKTRRMGERAINEWQMEYVPRELDTLGVLGRDAMYREFQNLLAQNVTFVTDEFKAIVSTGLQKYEIWKERKETPVSLWYVHFDNAGISVLTPDAMVGRFTSFEVLPDYLQEGVGMLRLTPQDTMIPGVGARVTDTDYWVVKKG